MESYIEKLKRGVIRDLGEIRGRISESRRLGKMYDLLLSCNPKPYPVSGLQHFLGTAFVAARLAEFFNMDKCGQALAFLAGLLHDYEKMGLCLDVLRDDPGAFFGEETRLYNNLKEHLDDIWSHAIDVASKLESGGVPRNLQKVAEFVRLGDYLTGGEESWNLMHVLDKVSGTLNGLGAKFQLLPVVIGKQRPITAMVSEKLNELLIREGLTPLISTPTGSLYISKYQQVISDDIIAKVYDEVSWHIAQEIEAAPSARRGSEGAKRASTKRLPIKWADNIITYSREAIRGVEKADKKFLALMARLPSLHKLSVSDIGEAIESAAAPADKIKLIVLLVCIYAKTIGKINEKDLKQALSELGLTLFKVGESKYEIIHSLCSYLETLSSGDLNELLEAVRSKVVAKMTAVQVNINDIKKVIKDSVGVGFRGVMLNKEQPKKVERGGSKLKICSICRQEVENPRKLREYLDRLSQILNINVSEFFHPDKQGRPESPSALEGLSGKMTVCPVCKYESMLFPAKTAFFDGMWASNIVYYPAVSVDLMDVVKEVIRNYVFVGSKGAPLVIPDYVASRVIIKTSDERGLLTKSNFLMALDLWYLVGGNLVLTTNALSVPPPWSGLPIEMEVTDALIEESVYQFMKELKIAKENRAWSRTRYIRRVLYEQVSLYVSNLDETYIVKKRARVGVRLVRSGLATTYAPALDVYSFSLKS